MSAPLHAHTQAPLPEGTTRWRPRRLYGLFGVAEAVTWTLLLLGMALKYSGVSRAFVPVFGLIHGVTFLGYCVVTCFVWVNQRWPFALGLLGLLSAIVPYGSVPFERWLERSGRLEGGWRLSPGGEAPRSWMEKLQAWCLRRPGLAILCGVLAIAAVTTVLLYLGPPVPRR